MDEMEKNLRDRGVEEVKPDLFVRKTKRGWRIIEPLKWDGKWRWKQQIKTIFSARTLFSLGIILLLVWAYVHDTQVTREFYFKVSKNPIQWCNNVLNSIPQGQECTDFWSDAGLCDTEEDIKAFYEINYTDIFPT